ncbi:MDR family oxidoreductase [uncultured Parvibaculum sp.]|uniref:acrylyl-CoA reductase (NADPH) n=1 Tax=uncultured Parvibaculum sp. TaxID=291828 RepID=UPI0030D9BF4F|tara:strand:- start:14490 stop:15482 length:993 start_codon:yes stop_codon:yes gene_type:complete
MTDKFRALRVSKTDQGPKSEFVTLTEADLMDGDVTVAVEYSTVNYKDGLALTGRAPIIRSWPLIPGIDFSGKVEKSDHKEFKPGDRVVLNGFGVGEGHNGGYAQKARVKGDWLVKLPDAISNEQAMAIGTAGYTAMLCVLALEKNGVTPDKGDVLVTGAAGGVGSVAIALLSKLGHRVIASTGRAAEADYLKGLGAAEIIDRNELSAPGKPLGKERWAGAVDAVGSHTLANVLAMTKYGGTVAACGLAQGLDLPASVAPFILRGITLCGIDSVMAPKSVRIEAYKRLAADLDMKKLAAMSVRAKLDDVPHLANDIVAGKVRGRVIVDVNA